MSYKRLYKGLVLEASALKSLSSGQFTSSTQLIKPLKFVWRKVDLLLVHVTENSFVPALFILHLASHPVVSERREEPLSRVSSKSYGCAISAEVQCLKITNNNNELMFIIHSKMSCVVMG